MQARLIEFGAIEIEGQRYGHDVVIEAGRIRRRHKGPSKTLRDRYGHTPLSIAEDIPWGGGQLIVGTGAEGSLPIDPEVFAEAARRGIDVRALPTDDACRLLETTTQTDTFAVLHVTC